MSSDGTHSGAESQKASSAAAAALLCHPAAAPTPMASSPGSKRPFRTRMACTNCHSAKVKCSGERSGCTRCQDNSLQCEYEISMVGRMSTKRGKRRKQDRPMDGKQQQQQHNQQAVTPSPSITNDIAEQQQALLEHQDHSRAPNSPERTASLGTGEMLIADTHTSNDASHGFQSLSDSLVTDAGENDLSKFLMFDYAGTSLDMDSTMLDNSIFAPTPFSTGTFQLSSTKEMSASNDDAMLRLDTELPSPLLTTLEAPQPACPPTPPMTSSSSRRHEQSNSTAPTSEASEHSHTSFSHASLSDLWSAGTKQPLPTHLSVLIEIISDLEAGVSDGEPQRIDSRLTLNRTAMAELSTIVSKDSFRTCRSCIVLVASALDLMLENYGYIVDSIIAEDAGNKTAAIQRDQSHRLSASDLTFGSSIARAGQSTRQGSQDTDQTNTSCSHASASKLRMGCYELDHEDQVLLRNHVICKELRRCIEVAGICVSLSQSKGGRSMSNHTRVRATLHCDVQTSAYRLVSALENRTR